MLQSKVVHVDAGRNECRLSNVICHMFVLVLVVILRCLHWLRPPLHVRPGGLGILLGIKLSSSYSNIIVITNNNSYNGLCITGEPECGRCRLGNQHFVRKIFEVFMWKSTCLQNWLGRATVPRA